MRSPEITCAYCEVVDTDAVRGFVGSLRQLQDFIAVYFYLAFMVLHVNAQLSDIVLVYYNLLKYILIIQKLTEKPS